MNINVDANININPSLIVAAGTTGYIDENKVYDEVYVEKNSTLYGLQNYGRIRARKVTVHGTFSANTIDVYAYDVRISGTVTSSAGDIRFYWLDSYDATGATITATGGTASNSQVTV